MVDVERFVLPMGVGILAVFLNRPLVEPDERVTFAFGGDVPDGVAVYGSVKSGITVGHWQFRFQWQEVWTPPLASQNFAAVGWGFFPLPMDAPPTRCVIVYHPGPSEPVGARAISPIFPWTLVPGQVITPPWWPP